MAETVAALPGQGTLLGSWAALAKTSPGARLIRLALAIAAAFPARTPLDNAILLDDGDRAAEAASQLSDHYASVGVGAWALDGQSHRRPRRGRQPGARSRGGVTTTVGDESISVKIGEAVSSLGDVLGVGAEPRAEAVDA